MTALLALIMVALGAFGVGWVVGYGAGLRRAGVRR